MLFLRHNYLSTSTMVTISAGAGGTVTAGNLFDNKKSTQYGSQGNNDDTTSTVITIDLDATQTISHIVLRNHNLKDFHMQHEEGTTLGTLWLADSTSDLIYHLGQAGTVISSFSTPAGTPQDITIANDGTLWLADLGSDLIYHLQQTGTVISSFSTPAGNARGLTIANDGTLWHHDNGTKLIYNLGQAGTVISSFSTPTGHNQPMGLTIAPDGTLWSSDNSTDLIYHLGQAGTVISSFSTPAGNARGLTIANDGTLWLADLGSDLIYHLGQAGTVISSFSTPATEPIGLGIFNGNFNNSAIHTTNNSATSSFFSFDTITTKRIRLTANKTITANEEKKVGELIISKLLYDFSTDRLPPAKAYKPDLFRKQVVHKMSDGGITLYNIAEKFKTQIGFTFLPTTSASTLRTIYESKDPFNFVPWETTTAWDGDIFECNWMGGYGLMGFSDNDLGNGYKGKIKIQETAGR